MTHGCGGMSRALAITAVALTLAIAVSAQTETILHSFTAGSDGGEPQDGFVADSKGNLYGTAPFGGTDNSGVVFELTPNSNGTWTEQVLYNFSGNNGTGDGAGPYSGLVFDSKGDLYGTTVSGGSAFNGTVFELLPGTNGTWTEKILCNFNGGSNGGSPYGEGLVLDSAGNIYGTTYSGGAYGFGTVFELVAGGSGTWTQTVLHSFTGGSDGASPFGSTPVFDSAGNLYGLAADGGPHDYGVVYQLSRGSNGVWKYRVVYAFLGGASGNGPTGDLVIDSGGNLFGTTKYTVFELIPSSNGTWTEKTLHRFVGGADGATPDAGLVLDTAGNLYGTTYSGGAHRGTVYELIPGSNGTWTEKILHSFSSTGGDGVFPGFATLLVDASGNVYGTTPSGGTSNSGVVFKIVP